MKLGRAQLALAFVPVRSVTYSALDGVWLEDGRAWATDRYFLAVVPLEKPTAWDMPDGWSPAAPAEPVLIPTEVAKEAYAQHKSTKVPADYVLVEHGEEWGLIRRHEAEPQLRWRPIPEKPLDVDRLFAKLGAPALRLTVRLEELEKLVTVARKAYGKDVRKVALVFYGESTPVLFRVIPMKGPVMWGLFMPCKADRGDFPEEAQDHERAN